MKIFLNNSPDNTLYDDIAESLYDLGSVEFRDYYKIHVNFVNDEWIINCDPKSSELPSLKLTTIVNEHNGVEVLRVEPDEIAKFPKSISFNDYNSCLDTANKYINLMDFLSALYDFEYEL